MQVVFSWYPLQLISFSEGQGRERKGEGEKMVQIILAKLLGLAPRGSPAFPLSSYLAMRICCSD